MRSPSFLLLLASIAACSGGSAAPMPDGPVNVGVIAGNHQLVTAARQVALPQQVVAQAVRTPSGQVSLQLRMIDAVLPPKAYAQTSVNGVPGLVVCAQAPDPKHALTPEVQCANTDALGKAYFVFHADTLAGESKATIAAALSTGTKVTDSVSATVAPGSYAKSTFDVGTSYESRVGPATFPADIAQDQYGNPVPFKLVVLPTSYYFADSSGRQVVRQGPDNFAHAVSDTLGATSARTIAVDLAGPKPSPDADPVALFGQVQVVTAAGVVAMAEVSTRITTSAAGTRTDYVTLHYVRAGCPITSNQCTH